MAKNILLQIVIILYTSPFIFGQYNPLVSQQNPNDSYSSETEFIYSETFQPKSERTAKILTLAVPAGSILTGSLLLKTNAGDFGSLLIIGGVLVGPSAGNMYAGSTKSVVKGIITRGGGLCMITIGSIYGFVDQIFRSISVKDGNHPNGLRIISGVAIIAGTGVITYSIVTDFFKSAENVKKYNGEYEKPFLTVAPTYFPKEKAPGISLSMRF